MSVSLSLGGSPPIRCSVCNKLVDRLQVEIDFHRNAAQLRVWCHGAEEVMDLTKMFVAEVGMSKLLRQGNTAFSGSALPSPVSEVGHD